MSTITPFLWFDTQAEEAMNFYVSLFPGSRVLHVTRAGPGPTAPVIWASFELLGREFHALNGGPKYRFTEAISLFVSVEGQAEVDRLWNALVAGGEESQCGWLKDKYGLSWQVIPTALGRMLGDPDRAKAGRAMQAMLQMRKLDIAALERAFAG